MFIQHWNNSTRRISRHRARTHCTRDPDAIEQLLSRRKQRAAAGRVPVAAAATAAAMAAAAAAAATAAAVAVAAAAAGARPLSLG